MDREARFEAIAVADSEVLVRLADEALESLAISITRGPTVGLLMIRHEEPVERLTFNLVEATVTEAEVLSESTRGYSMVMGRHPEHALAGAIVDLAMELEHEISPRAQLALREALAVDKAALLQEWNEVAPTTVRFEESL